jgi:hypothetical protein
MIFECPEGARGELNVRTIAGGGITAYVVFSPPLTDELRVTHPMPFERKAVPQFAEGMLQDAYEFSAASWP